MSESAGAAIAKYHGLNGLNIRHLFFTILYPGKYKIMALAGLVSGKSPIPGLHMVIFWLSTNMVEGDGEEG